MRGNANVSLTLLNANEKTERLNLPDSLKCQHTAKLTRGHCLYSDMGRVLAAITADTCGWSDSNGTDNLLVELGKWGLGLSDLLMTLNLFSKVSVDDDGGLHFVPGNSTAGDYIELYAP